MEEDLDTLVDAIAAALDTMDEINVTHKELPAVLTDPPEVWVKMGSGVGDPSQFGMLQEGHAIELWVYVGMTDAGANEKLIRQLWPLIVRKMLEDETFGGACEGIHDAFSYTTSWQAVGGPEYRKMQIMVPCTMNSIAL